ncbi:MAG: DNA polymerase III subunit delta' [Chloroflexi bacterium]|nr:DNA polymerase III subunit delta' [Chloroflexota bacterium]
MNKGRWQTRGNARTLELLKRSLDQKRLSHAYLLAGPRHVGKMTLAMDLARAVNCDSEDSPCGQCRSCQRVAHCMHSDIHVVSLASSEAARGKKRTEIGIEDIKEVIGQASLPPFEGKKKVFIVDGVERLSSEAANALLKTLEEPPQHVLFILLTVREQGVLPTISSRCQRLELKPLPRGEIEQLLAERGADEQSARLLSHISRGCPGAAIAWLTSPAEMERRRKELDSMAGVPFLTFYERFGMAADWAKRFEQSREEREAVIDRLVGWWRDILLLKAGCPDEVTNLDYIDKLEAQSHLFEASEITSSLSAIQTAAGNITLNANTKLTLEFLMLSLPKKGKGSPHAIAAGRE